MDNRQYLFLGDSITDAGHLWEADPQLLGNGYVKKLSQSPVFQNHTLVNRGQDGFTSADLLRLARRFTDLDRFDVISVLIGVNDLSVAFYADPDWIPDKFSENIKNLTQLLRENSQARLIFMEPFLFTPPDSHLHLMPLLSAVQNILQQLAADCHATYIPLHRTLTEACARLGTDAITVDGIHLTDAGNQIVADCFLHSAFLF